jgi:peptide/nickel transport system permease protein
MSNSSLSPTQKAIKRFKKNTSALVGLVILIVALLISIFAYLLASDATPNGNNQIAQLKTSKPNFTIQILRDKKDEGLHHSSLFTKIWGGEASNFIDIPITEYKIEGQNIIYKEYRGEGNEPIEGKKEIIDIIASQSLSNKAVSIKDNTLTYTDENEKLQSIKMTDAHSLLKDNIIQRKYSLGTDTNGRDILSRLIIGSRVSFSVGLISVIISLIIGVFLGALGGYFRGWVDAFIMWLINVFWAIPTILLAMGLMISMPSDSGARIVMVYVAVGLTMWVDTARLIRGQFLSLREMEFVEATRALGYSNFRIIFKHILPNCLGPLIVITASNFAAAILIESGLSYIGLGVQPPQPSWGSMLKEYFGYIGTAKSYLALFPGLAIMILVFAFYLIGNGLRDAFDVRSK